MFPQAQEEITHALCRQLFLHARSPTWPGTPINVGLSLTPVRCIGQVTKNGIVHLAFHPCTDTLILAAAYKSGHLGLWCVDTDVAVPSGSAGDGQDDGQDQGQAFVKGSKSGVVLSADPPCPRSPAPHTGAHSHAAVPVAF